MKPKPTSLLAETLRFAVPMWQMEMSDWGPSALETTAAECGAIVAESGDTLMFKGKSEKTRQKTRSAFNAMAQGLACMCMLNASFDLNSYLDTLAYDETSFLGD